MCDGTVADALVLYLEVDDIVAEGESVAAVLCVAGDEGEGGSLIFVGEVSWMGEGDGAERSDRDEASGEIHR